ncbi:MAG: UvrD-helicase domain-containing protein [Bryobacteraceae bacterium]|nr:UvrD-helicase domain-containing protein [Bryobacteraceae bacterium]
MTPQLAPVGHVVEASAGTGKTHRLIHEIAGAIEAGVKVDRIAAVTFTHAAAGSMKLRVREELEKRTYSQPVRDALRSLDRAFIGTIHAFCAHLIRQRPVEARVDPDFGELDEGGARGVFSGVFRDWIRRQLGSPSPTLRRALTRLAATREAPLDMLEQAAWDLARWRDQDAPWKIDDSFQRKPQLDLLSGQIARLTADWATCPRKKDPLCKVLKPVGDAAERIATAQQAGVDTVDTLESEILGIRVNYFEDYKGSGTYSRQVDRKELIQSWLDLRQAIDEYRAQADADLASRLRPELWQMVEAFQAAKRRAGQLDFEDLLIHARNLLQNEHARADLQARYDRLYIDEFQDTDPLQAQMLTLLAGEAPGRLFVVGDPKQSIYRFRRADAREYRRIRAQLLRDSGGRPEQLATNYRSTEQLQSFVNTAFAGMPDYLALTGAAPAPDFQPSVVALPVPFLHKGPYQSSEIVEHHAPNVVAACIEWLVKSSGWTVRENGGRVPVEPRHICILFRRMTSWGEDVAQTYVRALEAREIEHVLVGSKSFHQREEISAIRTALRAVEWLNDELSVFAVLKGALFSIPDSLLFRYHETVRHFRAVAPPEEGPNPEFAPIYDVFQLLRRLHQSRNKRPPVETVREILEHTRAHIGFAFHHGGERRLANVYRLCDLARAWELSSPSSFRAFVEHMDSQYAAGEQSEAPVFEQRTAGVKLMTVHKAKGLDFPVVILADFTARLAREGCERHVDTEKRLCAQKLCGWAPWELIDPEIAQQENNEELAEAERIAYVAATRARDLLIVAASGAGEWKNSWLGPVYRSLYPEKLLWQQPEQFEPLAVSGFQTVLDFDPESDSTSVRPGMHRISDGSRVFWLDPQALDLRRPPELGLSRSQMLRGTPEQAQAGVSAWQEWRDRREAFLESGRRPEFHVTKASDVRRAPECETIPFHTAATSWQGQRPKSSPDFGSLVHRILETATPENLEIVARTVARRYAVSGVEIEHACQIARAAFASPTLNPQNATKILREYPISVQLASGEFVEGVIDLAWTDGQSWTVVDYKTGLIQPYGKTQVQLYALALQRATGLPARAILLEV